jgi:hypothetical protein
VASAIVGWVLFGGHRSDSVGWERLLAGAGTHAAAVAFSIGGAVSSDIARRAGLPALC